MPPPRIDPTRRRRRPRSRPPTPIAPALATLLLLATPATAQPPGEPGELEGPGEGWVALGDFRGSTSTLLSERLNDLLFEHESRGDLYRDLGNLSLGLDIDFDGDNGELDWDNGFFRRVVPVHRTIAAGGTVSGDDLSRYLEVDALVSRGRLSWSYLPDLIGDGDAGFRVEGGTSLTLARTHPPLELGERPLEEVLATRPGLPDLIREPLRPLDKTLLRHGAEGLAALTDWIFRAAGPRTADHERGAIFAEAYAKPITLFLDLGLPVDAELFTADDRRLAVGDRVRQVTFVGLSPLSAGIREYGVSAGYQRFYRFLRETTIVKGAEGSVSVRVSDLASMGREVTPLKIRPEIRILRILSLGYTLFERVLERARTVSSETVYRLDLNRPAGMESLRRLLDDGDRLQPAPWRATAAAGDGVEMGNRELRRGQRRGGLTRARLFSLVGRRHRSAASNERVELDGQVWYREQLRARSAESWKTLGRNRERRRQFLVVAQGNLAAAEDRPLPDGAEPADTDEVAAMTLVSGYRDDRAPGGLVRRSADLLRHTQPEAEPHPALDALAALPDETETRLSIATRLAYGREHLERWSEVSEEELWQELAALFLGAEHRHVWSSRDHRRRWRAQRRAGLPTLQPAPDAIPGLRLNPRKPLPLPRRLRQARRLARRFERLQRLTHEADCLDCLAGAFARWSDMAGLQLLLTRLAGGDALPEVGYHFEVYTEAMLRPLVLSNALTYSVPDHWRALALGPPGSPGTGSDRGIGSFLDRDWDEAGMTELARPAEPRLSAGVLYRRASPVVQPDGPCLRLRLFTDVVLAADLRLRIDLRSARGLRHDRPIRFALLELGEPVRLPQTPFATSRFVYDLALPATLRPDEEARYTLLVRVLNDDGLPVSEEQQLRFRLHPGAFEEMPPACRPSG